MVENSFAAAQTRIELASDESAYTTAGSPRRRPTTSYGTGRPNALSVSRMISITETPQPVPRFKVTLSQPAVRWSTAFAWAIARSSTWM